MSDRARCVGCGTEQSYPNDGLLPAPSGCPSRPPKTCADCGLLDGGAEQCGCWVAVADMPLADLKGLLAASDLSLAHAIPKHVILPSVHAGERA